jgi:ribonuclease BN (tRNA processing enzyme)
MAVTLEFLGSGDAFGTGGRFHTCQLVRGPSLLALIDCGASAPVALQQRGVAQPDLTHIVLSHLHGDHFGGVPFLLLDAAYNRHRTTPLVIAGPCGVRERVIATLDLLFPGTSSRVLDLAPHRFVEVRERESSDLGGLLVTAFEVRHGSGAPAHALRLAIDGRTIAYSGDTEWTPVLADVASDADLFICECFGWTSQVPAHLTHELLVQHAHLLRCKRMLLTHLGQEMLDRQHEARWTCAFDGMVVTVS